jgi:hypothetical protein
MLQAPGEIPSPDISHRAGVDVRNCNDYRVFILSPEKKAGFGDIDLLSYFPEKVFHFFRPVGEVCDKGIEKREHPDIECPVKGTFNEPDNQIKYKDKNNEEGT